MITCDGDSWQNTLQSIRFGKIQRNRENKNETNFTKK